MTTIICYDSNEIDEKDNSSQLTSVGADVKYTSEPISLENINPETEVISVFVSSMVTREMIEKMPKLRLISCASTGYNNIDMAAAQEHGVAVANVPNYGENTVAEYAFMLLLALARKLRETMCEVSAARIDHQKLHGIDLLGKTLGVVGMGRIGQHSAQIGKGFGMNVVAFDPFPNEAKASEIGYKYISLDELARQSDFITIHAPYIKDQNHHIINKDFLDKIKPSAILINTARGELIDTGALVAALHEGLLAGAGLDVIEGEDLIDIDHEIPTICNKKNANRLKECAQINILERMPNVILTPHNAYNTSEALTRISKTSAENIINFLSDNPTNIVSQGN